MSDHSITLEGSRAAWMPICPQCQREVDGIVRWDYDATAIVFEAQCHGQVDKLRIPRAEINPFEIRDVESYIRNRVQLWQPFGN